MWTGIVHTAFTSFRVALFYTGRENRELLYEFFAAAVRANTTLFAAVNFKKLGGFTAVRTLVFEYRHFSITQTNIGSYINTIKKHQKARKKKSAMLKTRTAILAFLPGC